jgi:hypothetical protein
MISSKVGIGVTSDMADVQRGHTVSSSKVIDRIFNACVSMEVVPPLRARAFETVLLCARQTCDGHCVCLSELQVMQPRTDVT